MIDINDILEKTRQKGAHFNTYYCAICDKEHYAHSEFGLRHSLVKTEFGVFRQNPYNSVLDYEYAQDIV